MPRPQRCRRICNEPEVTGFSPDTKTGCEPIVLALDEFEVIRLVDLEKQTHEQAAKQMDIARSTVTEIYQSARYKIADSIVNGYRLEISGGNYRLCDGSPSWCYRKKCQKQNNPNVRCDHHDHEHGEGERHCGEHGCGSHSCH